MSIASQAPSKGQERAMTRGSGPTGANRRSPEARR